MDAIILAGGKGTRLQEVVKDLPKPMADVAGRPFLEWILDWLNESNVDRVVLSVGYKADTIISHFGENYKNLTIVYSIEDRPLGTGGAIKASLAKCESESVLIINGDTYFDIDLSMISNANSLHSDSVLFSLKFVDDVSRYGSVEVDHKNLILGFNEKNDCGSGLINGGVYIFPVGYLMDYPHEVFSIEEFFKDECKKKKLRAVVCDGYFVDIGVPEDYYRANLRFENEKK